jgi:colicin import membrane protein
VIAMIGHIKVSRRVSRRDTGGVPHPDKANVDARLPIPPPPERGTWGAFSLAVMIHVLLAAFLFYGMHWRSSPPAGAEAELWTAVPDTPTPHATPTRAPEAPQEEADIALQRKQRQQRQAQLQAQLAARQRREKLMQQQLSEAQNRRRQQIEEERQARLKALQAMAGGTSGASGIERAATGTGAGTGGSASSSYADKVRRRVEPNIVFAGDTSLDISTLVAIDCAPDGRVLNARIVRPSGNPSWDDAAMRAVQRSDPMPLDDNGTAPAHFTITFRPRAS